MRFNGSEARQLEVATGADSEHVGIPATLDPWLKEFLEQAQLETALLRLNGAAGAATARDRVIASLLRAAEAWLEEELDVAQAARAAECCEETIRRKVRQGELPAERAGQRGRYRIPRAAARALARSARVSYDANADARDIAKRLRRLG